MQATLKPGMYQPPIGRPCVHSVRDAAAYFPASTSTIRRACAKAGVRTISGATVHGMVELTMGGRTAYLPYTD